MTPLRQSFAQRQHIEDMARRQRKFNPEPINQHGLAYSDGTLARIRVMRGNGRLLVGDVELTPHTDQRYVVAHREGGGTYSTSADCCNCFAGLSGKRCRHRDSVKAAGGVEAIYKAWIWWADTHPKDNQ